MNDFTQHFLFFYSILSAFLRTFEAIGAAALPPLPPFSTSTAIAKIRRPC
jgi:hypothetical protein